MQQDCPTDYCSRCASECCLDKFREVLRQHGGRLTQERVALLKALCHTQGHFQPEDVVKGLAHQGHKLALTTLYRNLPLLEEAGIIRRVLGAEEKTSGVRYEHVWGQKHHDHLVCSRCGREVEFTYPAIEVLQEAVAREHGFLLTDHHLELVGICEACQGRDQ